MHLETGGGYFQMNSLPIIEVYWGYWLKKISEHQNHKYIYQFEQIKMCFWLVTLRLPRSSSTSWQLEKLKFGIQGQPAAKITRSFITWNQQFYIEEQTYIGWSMLGIYIGFRVHQKRPQTFWYLHMILTL